MRFLYSSIMAAVVVLPLTFAPATRAQSVKEVPPGPVPLQIFTAKKVFISNAGCDVLPSKMFTGGPDRCYNQFYAALNQLGRYEVVTAPADADLVLEISFLFSRSGFSFSDPEFRLVISDPRTRVVLWTLIQYVELAARIANRDRNFDQALDRLVQDFKALATSPRAAAVPPPR